MFRTYMPSFRAWRRYVRPTLFLAAMLLWLPTAALALSSAFLGSDATAAAVAAGAPYDMNDPAWLTAQGRQNRSIFAYKVFSALLMLGYQTEGYQAEAPQVTVLKNFKSRHASACAASAPSVLDSDCLVALDAELVAREVLLADIAVGFPLYGRMLPLAGNDVSADALAAIFWLPMTVVPAVAQPGRDELLQCVAGQCDGFIHDAVGVDIPAWPTPISYDSPGWYFVGAYFDPLVANSQMPSAAVTVDTVLHEFAHYLDGSLGWTANAAYPHQGWYNTAAFNAISFDTSDPHNRAPSCVRRRSDDIQDWISKYGYTNYADSWCQSKYGLSGYTTTVENWAEAFQMYITAGRDFRAAGLRSALIQAEYDWLKDNIFAGVEFDTDLPQGANSGCNDLPGGVGIQPGHMHCAPGYVWDFTLPHGAVDGACGSAAGVASIAAPTTGLCVGGATGIVGAQEAPVSWQWSCRALNGGNTATCSAPRTVGNPPGSPLGVAASAGDTFATVSFAAPTDAGTQPIDGYTVTCLPAGGTDVQAGSLALVHIVSGLTNGTSYTCTVTAHNPFGDGPASAPTVPVIPSAGLVSETFEAVAVPALPYPWQAVIEAGSGVTWQSAAGGSFPSVDAHSGANLMLFNAHSTSSSIPRARLVSPSFSLAGQSGAKLSFWMYREDDFNLPFTNDLLDIYVNTAPNTTGGTLLDTIPRSGYQSGPNYLSGQNFSYRVIGTPANPTASVCGWQAQQPCTGMGWYNYQFTIPASFAGATNYIVLVGHAGGNGHDIYVDDIAVAVPPSAPVIVNVAAGNGQATVTLSPPLSDGGNGVTGYAVIASPATPGSADADAGTTATVHHMTGLGNGVSYTFTATASNFAGSSAPSTPSGAVVPMTTPSAPQDPLAVAGIRSASVSFGAPADNGGSVITGYGVTWSPADGVDLDSGTMSLTHRIVGLTNGVGYTFYVSALNAAGAGALATSNVVTPMLATTAVAVTATPNPAVLGQPVTISAQVTGSNPGGTVSYTDGGEAYWLPVGLTGGHAQFVDSPGVGTHSLIASYSGDINNAASQSPEYSLQVIKADVDVILTAHAPSPSFVGRPVDVAAAVAVKAPGAGYPGGAISIGDGVDSCQFMVGFATGCTLTLTTAGTRNLVAHYAGDGQFNAADSPALSHVVSPPTVPDKPGISGAAASRQTLTVSVLPPVSDGGADITSYELSCVLQGGGAPATVSGSSSPLVLGGLIDGNSYLCSVRAGNAIGTGPASDALVLVPGVRQAAVSLTAHQPEPSVVGQSVTLSASVRPAIGVSRMAGGGAHACLLDSAGNVRCWGHNDRGQLGDGTQIDRPLPVAVIGLPGPASAIAAGESHSCAVVAGAVWCWGDNASGQLGQSLATDLSPTPVAVSGFAAAVSVHAGLNFTCAVDAPGAVACWGDNSTGALGDGTGGIWPTVSPSPVPVDFSAVTMSGGIVSLSGGWSHVCAIDGAGKVFCWGGNNVGQLGDNSTTMRLRPVAVAMPPGFAAATAIGTGFEHTCALSAVGAVWCWGGDDYDQLAKATLPGNQGYSAAPVLIPDLPGTVSALAAGFFGNCVADDTGAARCWGMASFVPAGGSMLPAAISMSGFVVAALAGGDNHICAVSPEGAAACWGYNSFGQLGDAGLVSRASAEPVVGFEPPTGVLHFSDGVGSCDATLPATSCALVIQHAGTAQLTVTYSGDGNYGAAVSPAVGHVVQPAAQAIILGPVPVVAVGGSVPVTASGGASGNPVLFTSLTQAICSVSGGQVHGIQSGLCQLVADQAGSADYLPAPSVGQSFQVVAASAPPAPQLLRLVPTKGGLKILFAAAAGQGGVAITDVVASCLPAGGSSPVVAHGLSSPLRLSGLVDGTRYTCSVHAVNPAGSSPESVVASAIVRAPAIVPILQMLLH